MFGSLTTDSHKASFSPRDKEIIEWTSDQHFNKYNNTDVSQETVYNIAVVAELESLIKTYIASLLDKTFQ